MTTRQVARAGLALSHRIIDLAGPRLHLNLGRLGRLIEEIQKMDDGMTADNRLAQVSPPAKKYLGGSMNRVIRIVSRLGEVRATVEDDFHHFRVVVQHDGQRVVRAFSDAPRSPFTLCPAAGARLSELVGQPLTTHLTALTEKIDARNQCTHQFDLACLSVAMAARGEGQRRYHAVVHDSRDRYTLATLDRDGERVLEWEMEGDTIVAPYPFCGRTIGSGFTGFVSRELKHEEAEAALVLRRAVFINAGRGISEWVDTLPHAMVTGGCWVQQPEQYQNALRNKGSTLDFTGRVDELTMDDEAWLDWTEPV